MKRLLLIICFGMFLTFITGYDYTADSYQNVTLILDETENYEADSYLNVSLVLNEKAPVTDSCTYTSGTWEVDCSDYCNITSEVNLAGEDITIIGDGEFTTTKDISNFNKLYISGGAGFCDVKCIGGCFV